MRKITNEAVSAFLDRKPFKKSNMKVHLDYGVWKLKLHGNTIATIDEMNMLSIPRATCNRASVLHSFRSHKFTFARCM